MNEHAADVYRRWAAELIQQAEECKVRELAIERARGDMARRKIEHDHQCALARASDMVFQAECLAMDDDPGEDPGEEGPGPW